MNKKRKPLGKMPRINHVLKFKNGSKIIFNNLEKADEITGVMPPGWMMRYISGYWETPIYITPRLPSIPLRTTLLQPECVKVMKKEKYSWQDPIPLGWEP